MNKIEAVMEEVIVEAEKQTVELSLIELDFVAGGSVVVGLA